MSDGLAPRVRSSSSRALRTALGFALAAGAALVLRASPGGPALASEEKAPPPAPAAAPAPAEDPPLACAECHDDESASFAASPHATLLRSVEGDACALCHGPPSREHQDSGGQTGQVSFGKLDPDAVARACAACHSWPEHVSAWEKSEYRAQGNRCTECHTVHEKSGARLTVPAKDGRVGPAACRVCHLPVAAAAAATIHAKVVADPHLDSCEMCHAGGEAHVKAVREPKPPAGAGFAGPPDCLPCHATVPDRHAADMPAWRDSRGAACTTCHRAHRPAAEAKAARALGPFPDAAALAAAGAGPLGLPACAACHAAPVRSFEGSAHARALAEKGPASCEACHGPASLHAAAGGPSRLVLSTRRLDGKGLQAFCLRCHAEKGPPHAREFEGSMQAKGGRTCASCHRVHAPAPAEGAAAFATREEAEKAARYVGSAKCAACHEAPHPGLDASKHAPLMAPARRGCEACHGPGSAHVDSGGRRSLVLDPWKGGGRAADAACLECHGKTSSPAAWGSHAHGAARVACVECHDPFGPAGEVARKPEFQLCAKCHGVETAKFRLPNHHPVPEGALGCSDCHDLHRPAPPVRAAKRWTDACAACHPAEATARLHPHEAGRADGCIACHEPHGTPAPRLLRFARIADLCLSCHIPPATHDMSPGSPYASCLACHVEIHGSDADPDLLR